MVLEIVHVVVLFAMLACGLVLVWYAHRINASHARGLAFLDAQDIDDRRCRSLAGKIRDAWHKEMDNSLRDTRAILGKLYSIAAETTSHERETHLIPPPIATSTVSMLAPREADAESDRERLSDSDAETSCMDKSLARAALALASDPLSVPETTPRPGASPVSRHRVSPRSVAAPGVYRAVSPPASATLLPSAPARIAAGIGPRPSVASVGPTAMVSTRRAPPTTVADPPISGVPSRRATVIGLQAVAEEAPDRISWQALKGNHGLGGSAHPATAAARFPETMMSMQAATDPGRASPSPARPVAHVETKTVCGECDSGFVAIGNRGIGKCGACEGSGLINAS